MKKYIFLCLLFLLLGSPTAFGQTPTYFYHNPSSAGSNNLFFHTINGRMIFIFTQAELASTGIPPGYTIGSLWFRHSSGGSTSLTNFQIHLGHTTNSVPDPIFWDNFNVNGRTRVLNEASYTYNAIGSPFNNVSSNWTEIPLTMPFVYNGTNNLAVQIRFATSSNISVLFYADNGGTPITRYHNNRGASTANRTTARPMMGFSEGTFLNQDQLQFSLNTTEKGQVELFGIYHGEEERTSLKLSKKRVETFVDIAEEAEEQLNWIDQAPHVGENIYRIQIFAETGPLLAEQMRSIWVELPETFEIFPNPAKANEQVYMNIPAVGWLRIQLYNSTGKLLRTSSTWVTERRFAYELGQIPAGIYHMRLTVGEKEESFRLIVN